MVARGSKVAAAVVVLQVLNGASMASQEAEVWVAKSCFARDWFGRLARAIRASHAAASGMCSGPGSGVLLLGDVGSVVPVDGRRMFNHDGEIGES